MSPKRGTSRKAAMSPQVAPSRVPQSKAKYSRIPKVQTINERDKHTMRRRKTELKTKPEVRKAKNAELRSMPTNVPKPNASRKTEKDMAPTIPMGPQLFQKMGDYIFEGDMSNTVTQLKSDMAPPLPIEMTYSLHQTGSSRRLKEWQKMYPSTLYQVKKLTHALHPATAVATTAELQESTVAGYGRANIHAPYSWYDWINVLNSNFDQKTSQMSCFNRTQILQVMHKMYNEAYGGTVMPVTFQEFLDELEKLKGGDQKYYFPMTSAQSQFKYINRNVMEPCHVSFYICTPRKDLPSINNPMTDFFNPWVDNTSEVYVNLSKFAFLDPDYRYDPAITAQQDVMGDLTTSTVSMKENVDNIMTLSTEVVREATPSGFSELFNENWQILVQKDVILQPGQELILNLDVHLSKLLDLSRFLGVGSTWGNIEIPQSFEGLTLAPLIKFWGEDVSGTSKGLSTTTTPPADLPLPDVKNRVLQSTAPRTAPTMITGDHTVKCRINVPNAPLRGQTTLNQKRGIESILMNFTTRARNLLKYSDPARGQQVPYWRCNDFCEYFVGENPLKDGTKYTQVASINTRGANSLGNNANPAFAAVTWLQPQVDEDFVQLTTASTRSQKSLKADVGIKNS